MRLEEAQRKAWRDNLRGDVPGGRPAHYFPMGQALFNTTAWASIHSEDHHLSVVVCGLIFGPTLELMYILVKQIMARKKKARGTSRGLVNSLAPFFKRGLSASSGSGLKAAWLRSGSVPPGAFGMRSRHHACPVLHAARAGVAAFHGVRGHLPGAATLAFT